MSFLEFIKSLKKLEKILSNYHLSRKESEDLRESIQYLEEDGSVIFDVHEKITNKDSISSDSYCEAIADLNGGIIRLGGDINNIYEQLNKLVLELKDQQ